MSNNFVAVMAKHPQLSQVKTRLAKTVGDKKALEVYKLLLNNIVTYCLPSSDKSYQIGCFITPTEMVSEFEKAYDNFSFYYPQADGDLGAKMLDAFNSIFKIKNADRALLIGADIPDLNSKIIENAFRQLSSHDVVVGPTDDGGYYLIGMKKSYACLFENISWGSSTVLESTLLICQKNSLKVAQLEILSDLDREEDLQLFPQIVEKMQ